MESHENEKKKAKLNYSVVHEEFEEVDVFHPGKQEFGRGSKCKECGTTLSSRNSTNLKKHLESKHKTIFQKVQDIDLARREEVVTRDRSTGQPASALLVTPPRVQTVAGGSGVQQKKRKKSLVVKIIDGIFIFISSMTGGLD